MYELIVEGMTCGGCVRGVTRSAQGVDGNAKVEVDLALKKVRIDTTADIHAVASAINEAGYAVKAINPV